MAFEANLINSVLFGLYGIFRVCWPEQLESKNRAFHLARLVY